MIELIVVIAVMALLSGVVVVEMGSALHDAKMRSACRIVASSLNYARSHAATTGLETRVVFEQGESVQVEELLDESQATPQLRQLTTSAGKRRMLPEGIKVTQIAKTDAVETEDWVSFTKLGQGEEAAIELSDLQGLQRYVIVDPITGRCSVRTKDEMEQDENGR